MKEIMDFNRGWLFHKGDVKTPYPERKLYTYLSAKTERMIAGPASRHYPIWHESWDGNIHFNGDIWEDVTLPHDFVIGGTPEKDVNSGFGYLPKGDGWYIKRFTLDKQDKNKRITLLFEGIAIISTIYLNGCLVKRNFSGYNTFEVDVTDFAKFGEENHLAIYVDASSTHEGWWYEGGGIYRPVQLIKSDRLSIDLWGIYLKPTFLGDGKWKVQVETTVRNDLFEKKLATVQAEIVSKTGEVVALPSVSGKIENCEKRTFTSCVEIQNPDLWSPEDPTQYKVVAKVYSGKKQTDEEEVKFGFRTYRLDADKGMFINDKHYKIQGVCGHADCGLFGKAVPDNIHRYKVQIMKEMGANGYRTSHYMQSKALMDALDENGFIVMDETRWFSTNEESKEHLVALMKRDRNRPSVFFWSIGNEEPHHCTEEGRRICKNLMSLAYKLDDTRTIITAVSHDPEISTVYDEMDVIGVNYNWQQYDMLHEKFPTKPIFSAECCATGTTRGWYYDDEPTKGYLSAYDHDINKSFICRERTWKFIMDREWLVGGYQWIAFEHRGESAWPRLFSQSGAIDAYMQKKDAFYQNQSHWTKTPMIHLLPHWNFQGMEGKSIKVWAYANVQEAELFLNGKSFGKQTVERYSHFEWLVPYEVGEIVVKGYQNGKVVAQDSVKTSKAPYALRLTLDTKDVQANGKDVALFTCSVVDIDGQEVPNASPFVDFHTNGACKVYSTGSNVSDHNPVFQTERKMWAGKITVAVKVEENAKEIQLFANADGLRMGEITVNL